MNEVVVATTVATNSDTVATKEVVATTKLGKYDSYAQDYPETIRFRAKQGVNELLDNKAKELGFSSKSKLIRAALSFALSHIDFKSKK